LAFLPFGFAVFGTIRRSGFPRGPEGGEHPPVDDVGENGGGILADPVELALLLELLETAGLAHIVHQNHDRDFVQMHHVAGGDLVSHLYRIVRKGR